MNPALATIEIDGNTLTLSTDQQEALRACLEELTRNRYAVLSGAAGTGKTTVMKAVLSAWPGPVVFLAPTGKAAVRMSESTGQRASTIHRCYSIVNEDEDSEDDDLTFADMQPPDEWGSSTLIVVDEASMVNEKLAGDLLGIVNTVGASTLWVGDHEQLPPVEGSWGVDLNNAHGKLTQVHRQALDSPVLEFATMIRQGEMGQFDNWGGDVQKQKGPVADAVAWREAGPGRVLLTWTNRIRKQANAQIRRLRGYTPADPQVGETLICTFNNHDLGIMNGETFEIESIRTHDMLSHLCDQPVLLIKPVGRTREFIMAPESFDAEKRYPDTNRVMTDRAVHRQVWSNLFKRGNPYSQRSEIGQFLTDKDVTLEEYKAARTQALDYGVQGTWGYCLTVHKSQGSQWSDVGFMSCPGFRRKGGPLTLEEKRRMLYTAVTRAESRFHIFTLTA